MAWPPPKPDRPSPPDKPWYAVILAFTAITICTLPLVVMASGIIGEDLLVPLTIVMLPISMFAVPIAALLLSRNDAWAAVVSRHLVSFGSSSNPADTLLVWSIGSKMAMRREGSLGAPQAARPVLRSGEDNDPFGP